MDVAIRIDSITLHAQSEVGAMSAAAVAASHGRAVGGMNDVVRSGVFRALPAGTIGANGAMMRGR